MNSSDPDPERRSSVARRWWRRSRWPVLLAFAAAMAMHWHVLASGADLQVPADDAPHADAIVVPGARIHADGTPYDLLADRLQTALELFRVGAAPRIVLSGRGGGGIDVDEVAGMRRWLAARGVPDAAMVDDDDGLRTVTTMRHCRDAFGLRSVLVVTNDFHLPRALFLAAHCGLDAHGVVAAPRVEYPLTTVLQNRGREVLARVLAWWEVFVLRSA